jgi:hypothetical protein
LAFLDRRGIDLEGLYEVTDLPTEFIRDPTCWLDSSKVERFLRSLEQSYGPQIGNENFIEQSGHVCFELRSWGVLDSVLRMMQKPEDIYLQPQRFLSYFISPAPPVGRILRDEVSVSFELPIFADEYPLTCEYLRAALEALPCYVGKPMAQVAWSQNKMQISWAKSQRTLLPEKDLGNTISPELINSMILSLEESQSEIERKTEEVASRDREITHLKKQLIDIKARVLEWPTPLDRGERSEVQTALRLLRDDFLKFHDYFARAQQLITLLVGQDRLDPQVRAAMKRVHWDFVATSAPQTLSEIVRTFETVEEKLFPNDSSAASPGHLPLESDPRLDLQ